MKILLMCEAGRLNLGDELHSLLKTMLEQEGYEIETVVLNREDLKPCLGCISCWLKTPGQCIITNDPANDIVRKQVNADAIIFISKITYGGFSADIKAFLDRSIQNISPYFKDYGGEMHQPKRYKRFPVWITVGYGDVSDEEKLTFIKLAERNALNMFPPRYLAITVNSKEDLEKEAGNILSTLEVDA